MNKTLEFTLTVNGCLGCKMCPQQKLGRAYTDPKKKMVWDDFKTILDKLPIDCRVDFSGYSEPFLNPVAPDFISEAVFRGFKVHLFTTLVGLTEIGAEKLSKARPEYVRLHAPDLKEFTYDTAKWLKQFKMFQEKSRLPFTVMAMSDVDHEISKAVMDSGHVIEYPTMLSRAGNLGWVAPHRPITGRVNCAMSRYHSNVVLPNGDVWGCCHTYDGEIKLGNLLTETYAAIYNRAEEWAQDKNPPKNSPCRVCDWAEAL